MTKEEAYEIVDMSIGESFCYDCPYFLMFEEGDHDCFVDTPFHCPYVELEVQSG